MGKACVIFVQMPVNVIALIPSSLKFLKKDKDQEKYFLS